MAWRMSSPAMVLRFSMAQRSAASLVMNEINSDTHSCTHSLASFAILDVPGIEDFMIRATFAIWCAVELAEYNGTQHPTYRQEAVLLAILAKFLLGKVLASPRRELHGGIFCCRHGDK